MDLSIGTKTDSGQRPNNEDCLAVVDARIHRLRVDGVLIIADGMGGRNYGEKAAEVTTQIVGVTLAELLNLDSPQRTPINDALLVAFQRANAAVFQIAQEDPECEGMGTTCVVGVLADSRLHIAYAGDSRAYVLRGENLLQITEDHSYVAEQVRAGLMTEEKARKSRFRNIITRAVGIEEAMVPDILEYPLDGVDAILLCTDGLTNMAPDADLQQIVELAPTAQVAANWLISLANRNGGSDNITAIVARLDVTPEADRRGTLVPSMELPEEAFEPDTGDVGVIRGARGLSIGLIATTFVATFLLIILIFFANRIEHGYHFSPSPPFLVAPPATFTSSAINLAALSYDPPVTIFKSPLQGSLLTRSTADGTLTAMLPSGEVIRISSDGHTVSKLKAGPDTMPPNSTDDPPSSLRPSDPGRSKLHIAKDRQENYYVSDAVNKAIKKYRSNGEVIEAIDKGKLIRPEAIAVAEDGTVYVIDAGYLKVIHAHPASLDQ